MTAEQVRIGELFSGYGGLGMGVQSVIGGRVVWHSDNNRGARRVLAHRYPDVPNLGDVTKVDWAQVPRVDVLTGGTPCQDLSAAGKRGGMRAGMRSNLWVAMREAIATLRPSLVVWENVKGACSAAADSAMESCTGCVGDRSGVYLRALGRLLGDLSNLGYDARWHGVRAADIGAPHLRLRVFVAAYAPHDRPEWRRRARRRRARPAHGDLCAAGRAAGAALGDPEQGTDDLALPDFGQYADAVATWETLTRPAPPPLMVGRAGQPQLAPAFSEWLMGLPAGWVTDVPGISRHSALRLLGNGVVPQQAAAALRILLDVDDPEGNDVA